MSEVAVPIIAALLVWWSSTGALIWLVNGDRARHAWVAVGATAAVIIAMGAVVALRDDMTVQGAYAGFVAGIALWAWHETMFLLGYISGPRRAPCPPGLKTWRRFVVSTQTVIHHELAIAAHGAMILALSVGAGNWMASATYLLLWGMRINAKLVVFLGAPNISDQFLPAHLTYLSSYFGKRRITAFFPLFITVATATATLLTHKAFSLPAGGFEATGCYLLAALAWLAVFEHWALVLPVPDEALWGWIRGTNTKMEDGPARRRTG